MSRTAEQDAFERIRPNIYYLMLHVFSGEDKLTLLDVFNRAKTSMLQYLNGERIKQGKTSLYSMNDLELKLNRSAIEHDDPIPGDYCLFGLYFTPEDWSIFDRIIVEEIN